MFSESRANNRHFRSPRSIFIFPFLLVLFSSFFLASFCFVPKSLAAERIVCASYPVWLFARYLNYGRDYWDVDLLTNPATGCPHEFAPTPKDLERLTQTKVLVENGLNLESYLDRALKVAPPDLELIDASSGLPTLSLIWGRIDFDGSMSALIEGRAPSSIPNPHIFLSPALAKGMVANIAATLSRLDPSGAEHYAQRLASWESEMIILEENIANFRETRRGYKIVTSHGFMDYLAHDLGLVILADISPLGSEAAPSAARISGLGSLIRNEKISAIILDPEADPAVARVLSAETKISAAILDASASGPADPPIDFYQRVIKEDIDLLSQLLPANVSPPLLPPGRNPPPDSLVGGAVPPSPALEADGR
ncbi:MAG: metal ABC transporter substrate-binding protein [Deltaproteobacteria bacterium]|jgi:zinc/manganese transport system substrate-binding protein/zinc transport system substrate-binding protein|nr:metal ABC transporter substrate-binding protein [Deltaproteobacteria bacterium]